MLRHCAAAVVALVLVTPAAQAEPQTVRVQLVRALAQAPYYIAAAKGYFAKEGITVESTDVRSALDAIAPLATGQLDVSVGAATAGFFNAAHQGFDLRVVAAMGYQGPVMATQPLIRKARCGTPEPCATPRISAAARSPSTRQAISPNISLR
jgi:ABC-type nitrate/sulfonate/bicarbonate transport system substrate-binding protein